MKTDSTILYSSCFDANGGLFETLLGPEDAIFSDALNHTSIIDGIRLCKAQRYRYANGDMADLEVQLKQATGSRFRLIVTDGVFSMDGHVANLPGICELADRYDCLIMVDDSHAVGFMGKNGRGTHEYHGVENRIDIITGTLGKLAEPVVDTPQDEKKSLNYFANDRGPTFLAIPGSANRSWFIKSARNSIRIDIPARPSPRERQLISIENV